MLIMFIPVWYVAPTLLPSLAWANFPLWPEIHICECQMGVLSKNWPHIQGQKNWPRILHVNDRSETGSHTQSRRELLQLMMHFALIFIVNCIKRILYLYCAAMGIMDNMRRFPAAVMCQCVGKRYVVQLITFVLMTARCGWCNRIPR